MRRRLTAILIGILASISLALPITAGAATSHPAHPTAIEQITATAHPGQTVNIGGGMAVHVISVDKAHKRLTVNLCLANGSQNCATMQGAGNQMDITNTSGANLTLQGFGANGLTFQSQAPLCMRLKTDHSVVGSNGACQPSGDAREVWDPTASLSHTDPGRLVNEGDVGSRANWGTFNDAGGSPIWGVDPSTSGVWTKVTVS